MIKIKKITLDPHQLIKINDYTAIVLTIGILALVNYLFTLLPLRLDLTKSQNYSLSSQTKKIVKNLDDIVNIKVYLSKNIPTRLQPQADELKDALKNYESLSRGKIKVKYIDPGEDAQLLQEAQSLGIPKLQFSDIEGEKFQVSQGFFGLAIQYADKSEAIPLVESTSNLEYELTSRLAKLTRSEPITVAFSSGHDELTDTEGLQTANQLLEQEFTVTTIPVSTQSGQLLEPTANLLIVAGPRQPFTKDETYLLDQYVASGKSLLLLSSGVQVDDSMQATTLDLGLKDWLTHYNLNIQSNLILDASSEIANFNSGLNTFLVRYPFWVSVLPSGIAQHSVTASLETLLLPWTSSLDIKDDQESKPTVLLSSSDQAWDQTGTYNLDPTQDYEKKEIHFKTYPLAALLENNLKSAFKAEDKPASLQKTEYKESSPNSKLAVVADSHFIQDNFLKRFQTNAAFFLNLVEYLASDANLSSIRTKGESYRPLKPIPDNQKSIVKYANIFGPSLAAGIIGLVYLSRRNKKNAIDS